MCEIAILDPERYSLDKLTSSTMTVYRNMRDSLGIVAVRDTGPRFSYDTFIDTDPEVSEVRDFLDEHDGSAERFIVHGRLATTGEVTDENAHPIEIECDQCDVDYLLHNGIVRGHERLRERHEQHDHDYTTSVDSEVIAHEHGDVPASFEDGRHDLFGREPAYILLNKERMYVYATRRYQLTDDFRMALSNRSYGPSRETTDHVEVIIRPEMVRE
jgi:glutamine phosphoribosylpyrophosphate amidotransferase